jgi:hypothetical protein
MDDVAESDDAAGPVDPLHSPDEQPAGTASVFLWDEEKGDALFSPPPPPPTLPPADGPLVPAAPQILDASIQGWVNPLHDDNALIFRESRDATSFLSHRGGFGLTTLGYTAGLQMETQGVFSLQPKFAWHFRDSPNRSTTSGACTCRWHRRSPPTSTTRTATPFDSSRRAWSACSYRLPPGSWAA